MKIKLHKVWRIHSKLRYACYFLMIFLVWKNIDIIGSFLPLKKLRNFLLGLTDPFEFKDYLISTPGCNIPNYADNIIFANPQKYDSKCPVRAVFIKSFGNDKIVFQINKKNMLLYVNKKKYSKIYCCYKFITESKENSTLKYSKCSGFKNGGKVKLLQETLRVTCTVKDRKQTDIVYDDVYKILKKRNYKKQKTKLKPWNVLILGIRGISRAHFNNSMQKTSKIFQDNEWLDYRGFNKIAHDSISNIVSLLTGERHSAIDKKYTNENILWNVFENAGYVTAYGDDDRLQLIDKFTRKLQIKQPDHHIQPIYRIDQKRIGNYMCTKKLPSGVHLLEYAYQFVNSYKNANFFGFFWLNSYSQQYDGIPSLVDSEIVKLIEQVKNTGALKNTFIIFLSDTGLRLNAKSSIGSYYEEKLPIMFIWVPLEFRKIHRNEYHKMKINQFALVTPYDVYYSMRNIIEFNEMTNNTMPTTCSQCRSIFKTISLTRTCADADIDEKFCPCRDFYTPTYNAHNIQTSMELVVTYIKNRSESVQTIECMICEKMEMNNLVSVYSYAYSGRIYYVLAIKMDPRDIIYEATVVLQNNTFTILHPIKSLNGGGTGRCATKHEDSVYCVCNVTSCKTNLF